jgi:hypothetical protein
VFSFEMRLPDGSPAEPPRFKSAVPNWKPGDVAMVRPGFEYRILSTAYDEQLDQTTWTVELVRNGQ